MPVSGYLKDMAGSLFHLLLPPACAACNKPLIQAEEALCLDCLLNLPYTDFHKDPDNTLAKQYWGKTEVRHAAACFYFHESSKVRNLLHQIKYQRNKKAAEYTGRLYGELLQNSPFAGCDYIVPVPLHPSKLRTRGYNQTQVFASGLGASLQIPLLDDLLYRETKGASQTSRNRENRFNMLQGAFKLKTGASYDELIKKKHILLADDVITSGATLEICAGLFRSRGCSVSIIALAYTQTH